MSVPPDLYKTARDATGKSYVTHRRVTDSRSSPRRNGKLELVANRYMKYETRRTVGVQTYTQPGWYLEVWTDGPLVDSPSPSLLDNRVRSGFATKVANSRAALGVTLGSWKQSRDMIVARSKTIVRVAKGLLRRRMQILQTSRGRRRKERLEDLFLEAKFGLVPLLQDVAAAMAVFQDPSPRAWVSSRAKHNQPLNKTVRSGGSLITQTGHGRVSSTLSARVTVSNENVWIANRLGLLNLPGVAWDLVPWSFVVNMFVNVNQLVGSVTEFAGVNLSNLSRTDISSSSYTVTQSVTNSNYTAVTSTLVDSVLVVRSVGQESIPSYKATVRVPGLDWGLAVTAFALATQQIRKI